jgi:hypothetical protein
MHPKSKHGRSTIVVHASYFSMMGAIYLVGQVHVENSNKIHKYKEEKVLEEFSGNLKRIGAR